MGRLDEKVAVVTAAGGYIAGATARVWGREGASVVCVDIAEENVKKTAQDINDAGGKAIAIVCDVTDEDSVAAACAKAKESYGLITCLMNAAAGQDKKARVHETDITDYRRVLDINLTGMVIIAKHCLIQMLEAGIGSIVNISSIYGMVSPKERAVYATSKGGIRMLTKNIAIDYAADNIRCNSIMPGPIQTPRLLVRNPSLEAVLERHGPRLHVGRLGQPEEIAAAALFLASDEASYVSGTDMTVDAGYTSY